MAISDIVKIKYRKDGRVKIPQNILRRFNYTIFHYEFTQRELIISGGPGPDGLKYDLGKRLFVRKSIISDFRFKFNHIILTSKTDIQLTSLNKIYQ